MKIHHLRCATAALAEVWYGNGAEETEYTTNDRETEVGVVAERLSLDIVEEGEEHQRVEDGAVSREEEDVAVVGVETLATSLSHRVVSPHEDEADLADGATVGEDKEQGGQDKHDTDEEEDRAGGEEESQGDISGRSEEDVDERNLIEMCEDSAQMLGVSLLLNLSVERNLENATNEGDEEDKDREDVEVVGEYESEYEEDRHEDADERGEADHVKTAVDRATDDAADRYADSHEGEENASLERREAESVLAVEDDDSLEGGGEPPEDREVVDDRLEKVVVPNDRAGLGAGERFLTGI